MTQTGHAFELAVKSHLEVELQLGGLGISPAAAQVFHRKKYYSLIRQRDLIVDVSLEVVRPGATAPFLVWVWECKDYSHRVPVDDIEEFHAKLEQIGANRTKGTVVSRNGFQKAAVAAARAWGIGLIRFRIGGVLDRLLESVQKRILPEEAEAFLAHPNGADLRLPFYGITGLGVVAETFGDFARAEIASSLEEFGRG